MNTKLTSLHDSPHLRRVLSLWDLVFYGIVLVQPVAAVSLFGIASRSSHGHMVTTLLIAMFGMMLTAISYGRLASIYSSAGSAYTYVSKGLNVHLGFMAGWAMFLDYLIIPIINTIYACLTLQRFMPTIPFIVWVLIVVFTITYINLRGIKTTARSNEILLVIMCLVIGAFIVLAIQYISRSQGWSGLLTTKPFYNPETFNFQDIMMATSFSALTYIGFDGVTTLAEEVKNPKRNLLFAPVLVCLITGLFSGFQMFLAQHVWPDYNSFSNPETAFFDVADRVGGPFLFNSIAVVLLIACLGSGIAGQAGAARLLFAMGRDRVLPPKIFASLNSKNFIPANNVLIMAGLTIIGSVLVNFQSAAELLNFGAFLAFMGVNITSFKQFYFHPANGEKRLVFRDAVIPLFGFLVNFIIWINLPTASKLAGGVWFVIGFTFLIIRTRGFKFKQQMIDYS